MYSQFMMHGQKNINFTRGPADIGWNLASVCEVLCVNWMIISLVLWMSKYNLRIIEAYWKQGGDVGACFVIRKLLSG